jgi:hypothetical protein
MNKRIGFKLMLLLPVFYGFNACGDGKVDIGNTTAQLSDYAAGWDGYAEAATFPTGGSDRVRLQLDAAGQGTLRLGDAALLPPPTMAAGGYLLPPGGAAGATGTQDEFRDGFEYPVHDARVETGRIRFGIDPLDLFAAWCALTPSYPNAAEPSGYGCGTGAGVSSADGCAFEDVSQTPNVSIPVDCGIYQMCRGPGVCTCTASACAGHVTPAPGGTLDNYQVLVDGAIESDGVSLTGTLAIKDGSTVSQRITIRLQRNP